MENSGKGTITYENGDVYDGAVRNNEPHGVGKMTYKDGRVFEVEGIWKKGEGEEFNNIDIPATDTLSDSIESFDEDRSKVITYAVDKTNTEELICGSCKDLLSRPIRVSCCKGVYCFSCLPYSGSCCPGCQEDYGKVRYCREIGEKIKSVIICCPRNCGWYGPMKDHGLHWSMQHCFQAATGYIYDGEWKDGRRDGQGTICKSDGSLYGGEWKDGNRRSKRIRIRNGEPLWDGMKCEGISYEGAWKDDEMHGKGNYKWADGRSYEGEFKHGKKHGNGTYKWPDGSSYKGEWKDGVRHGKGMDRKVP